MAGTDYHSNLEVVDRFPWCIYHRPIRNAVLKALEKEGASRSLSILNIGCGLSQIFPHIDSRHSYTGVDVDERAVESSRQRYESRGARFLMCEGYSLPFEDETFDFAFATEVVEHVLEPQRWLDEVVRVVRPGGCIQLSTPNYGSVTLPLVEKTFLELVARSKGFTRKGIHPTPFSVRSLRKLLETKLTDIEIRTTPFLFAIVASGRKA